MGSLLYSTMVLYDTYMYVFIYFQFFPSVYLMGLMSEKEELKYSLTINGVLSVMMAGILDHLLFFVSNWVWAVLEQRTYLVLDQATFLFYLMMFTALEMNLTYLHVHTQELVNITVIMLKMSGSGVQDFMVRDI